MNNDAEVNLILNDVVWNATRNATWDATCESISLETYDILWLGTFDVSMDVAQEFAK